MKSNIWFSGIFLGLSASGAMSHFYGPAPTLTIWVSTVFAAVYSTLALRRAKEAER
jgi:hypothetical protein